MATHDELDWNVNPAPRKKPEGDINSPGYGPRSSTQHNSKPKHITGLESNTGVQPEMPPEPEVRLISAEWKPGSEGFEYNKPCTLEVRGEYLKKTIRVRVTGQLYGTYNGEEYDLLQEVEGFLEKDTGIAKLELKHLWFIDKHYQVWRDDRSVPCSYRIKEISHSRGENTIESPVLEMPRPRPILKEGRFDDVAVGKYASRTTDTNGYVPGEWVKIVQQSLRDFGFDEVGAVDGDFGRKTHDAVLLFQECARNAARLKDYSITDVTPKLTGDPDGIVGDKTWAEIDLWSDKEYFRPVADLSITLAVNPSEPDIQDDEYLLIRAKDGNEINVSDIVGYRTVRDDAVSGDQQLTLDFFGMSLGEKYELVLRRNGEDHTLVQPFVWNKRDQTKYAPATVTLKATVREFDFNRYIPLGGRQEIRNERLIPLKSRWLYVFARKAEEGGSAWLSGEYWFDQSGKAHPVHRGTWKSSDIRKVHSSGRDTIDIPARLNGDSLRVFIGASPFQLNTRRIEELEKDPSRRCYEVGTESTLGTIWLPQRLEQHKELLNLNNSADPSMEGIENDTLLVGVRDLLSQSCERNKEYRTALDQFLEVRFDTTVKDDGQGNISLQTSEEQGKRQMEQLTGGLVIHALTGGKDGAAMDEALMRKCLRNGGADFKGWLSQKMHAHVRAYAKVQAQVQKVASCLQDAGWQGVEEDIASHLENQETTVTAFDYLYNSIARLDELDAGRDLLVEHCKGRHPVLNVESGLIASGKIAHKSTEPYVKVLNALTKVYAAAPAIEASQKKATIFRLLQNGLDAKINVIPDSFDKNQYLDEFADAMHGERLGFDRFEIDPNSVARMRNLDNLEFLIDSFGAVLDGLSVATLGAKLLMDGEHVGRKDYYEGNKNSSALIIYFGKLKYFRGTRFAALTKRANPIVTVFFSTVDASLCIRDSYKEFASDDIDASVARSTAAAGHLMTAAGTVMVLFPPTAAVGVAILVVGTVLGTGGGIWHNSADDSGLTMFLKKTPWGIEPEYSDTVDRMMVNLENYLRFLGEEVKE